VLPLKIAERLEKYPLFEGLSCLQAVNLTWAAGQIPAEGEVGKLLKSGDVLMCDVTSKDLWLAVRLEVPAAGAVLLCEIKMDREATVAAFRVCLYHCALEVLNLDDKTGLFSPQDMHLTQNTALTRRLSMYTPSQSQIGGQELEPEWKVGSCFDFVTCYVSGSLPSRAGIQVWEPRSRSGEEINKSPVIRKIRIEELTAKTAPQKLVQSTQVQSQCLGCCLY